MTGSNLDSASSGSAQLTGGRNSSDASINASEEPVHEDSSSYGEDGTSMSVNGDVGISSADDSDVEGG